ncbi:MAG: 2OG-Fe(II) oxygenase [Acidimicrobiales bacterium]
MLNDRPAVLKHVDLAPFEERLPELVERYAAAEPYPHITLDNVLHPDALHAIYAEFEAIPESTWTNYLHLNERKFGHTDVHHWGHRLQELRDELSSERFVSFVSAVTGIADLHADDVMDGGGLHRSLPGGFLNIHADFSAHHSKPGWRRRVNLLLYLNPDWQPDWGGALQLWSKDMQRCVTRIEPKANRILLFTTDADSFHGHPEPLRFPAGQARRSLALYYFTIENHVVRHATDYRSRPGDGISGKLKIWIDKKALATYDLLKTPLRLSDGVVSRALGALNRRPRSR